MFAPFHDQSLKTSLAVILPTALLLGLLYVGGKMIEVRPPARPAVTGYGEGRVGAKPDTAEITLGVQTGRKAAADEAMQLLTRQMHAVLEQLKEQGIDENDIATTGISLYPAYDWIDGQQISRGFEASQNIVVTARDIGKVGQTITASTKAGANQVMGVRLYVNDLTSLRKQARSIAIESAQKDAREFANDMKVVLGDLGDIRETSSGPSGQPYYRSEGMGGEGGAGGMAIPSGEQELIVGIYLTYEVH